MEEKTSNAANTKNGTIWGLLENINTQVESCQTRLAELAASRLLSIMYSPISTPSKEPKGEESSSEMANYLRMISEKLDDLHSYIAFIDEGIEL